MVAIMAAACLYYFALFSFLIYFISLLGLRQRPEEWVVLHIVSGVLATLLTIAATFVSTF